MPKSVQRDFLLQLFDRYLSTSFARFVNALSDLLCLRVDKAGDGCNGAGHSGARLGGRSPLREGVPQALRLVGRSPRPKLLVLGFPYRWYVNGSSCDDYDGSSKQDETSATNHFVFHYSRNRRRSSNSSWRRRSREIHLMELSRARGPSEWVGGGL